MLRYSATDDDGLTSSCDVLVDVANAPPMVVCPEATRGIIDRPLMLTGSATDDEGIASVMWSVTQRPAGAVTSLSPANALATSLLSDTVGPHTLTLTVAATILFGMFPGLIGHFTGNLQGLLAAAGG